MREWGSETGREDRQKGVCSADDHRGQSGAHPTGASADFVARASELFPEGLRKPK